MTALLEQVLKEVASLSEKDQERIDALILDEIAADRRWVPRVWLTLATRKVSALACLLLGPPTRPNESVPMFLVVPFCSPSG